MIQRRSDEDDPPHRRRSGDSHSLTTAVGRVTVAVMLALGGAGGGWLAKDRVAQASAPSQNSVDQAARDAAREAAASVVLLRAELSGDLRAIRQQQEQMAETLKELRDESRRGRR